MSFGILDLFLKDWSSRGTGVKVAIFSNGIFMSVLGYALILPMVLFCTSGDERKMRLCNYFMRHGCITMMACGVTSAILVNPYIAAVGYVSALSIIPYSLICE